MKSLFVDTGAFLAKEIVSDQHHDAANNFWREIARDRPRLYSSEHVLDETATLLARRTSYAWAAQWGHDVLSAGIEWLPSESQDLLDAFGLMKKIRGPSCFVYRQLVLCPDEEGRVARRVRF